VGELDRSGTIVVDTPAGEVRIWHAVVTTDPDGLSCLEVYAAPGDEGETLFHICNPPTGVRRNGEVVTDPVGAIVEVLAAHGGARRKKRAK
jgi:hypothetical protein